MAIKITREEFHEIYIQGEEATFKLFEKLVERLNALEEKVTALEARITKDSHNSSKPPSSDWNRKTPQSLRVKSGKSSGGQPGHEGHSLKQTANPDHIIESHCSGICHCGRDLSKAKVLSQEKRQVTDLPEPKPETTEFQADIVRCTCGALHTAEFPKGVDAPVQYGPRIRTMLVYLSQYQLLPQKRLTDAMADLFGVQISQGTVNKAIQEAHDRLEDTETAIKAAISSSPVVHGDETGMYVDGKRIWQHTLGTALFTYFFCHNNRGKAALRDDGTLEKYIGRLMHDGWMSYFDIDCLHAFCNAHHLRDLVFLTEKCGQRWAGTMIKMLCHSKKTVDRAKEAGRKQLAPQTLHHYRKRYESILACGERSNPRNMIKQIPGRRGRIKQTSARNMIDHLDTYADETLAFMYDFTVPFDNNTSERDLRMSKVKQKISGCFRSMFGAQAFCRIRGYISTVRKHNVNVFDQLVKCFDPSVEQAILLP
jgi:transposase